MTKQIVKKRKLRVTRFLLVLFILGVFAFSIYLFLNSPIRNIVVENTNYLNDDYIIDLAEIKDYPAFYLTSKRLMEKKIKKSSYINDVHIKRRFFNVLVIRVEENIPLFVYETNQKIVFDHGNEIDVAEEIDLFRVPRLMNYVPDTKYQSLIKHLKQIDPDILGKVSEITYVPNDFDPDRFLLYMDDQNSVYLTLTKFKMLNYYNKVLSQLDGRKGILYLDSGNHFQIKE